MLLPTTCSHFGLCPWCALPQLARSKIEAKLCGWKRSVSLPSVPSVSDIFIRKIPPLLHCICDFLIPFMSSVCHSPPPPSLRGEPIYHWPKEGLHFVCFRGSPSISCSPNERGCCVPDGPGRFEGARSPVPSPTWGGNYPSGGPQRGAPPAGQSNSHTVGFHLWAHR